MSSIEQLKRRRGGHKGVITSKTANVDITIGTGDKNRIAALRDTIKSTLVKIQALDEEILELTPPEEINQTLIGQSDYTLEVSVTLHKLDAAFGAVVAPGVPPNPALPVPANIKLPKLDIKPYEGDVTEWNSFWELYKVSVHNRAELEAIQKFSYLKSLLQGEALELIAGFKLEANNYVQAVNLLETTYGKKDEIKLCLVKKLLQTEYPSYEAESLQKFRSQFECSIRSLDSENLTLQELYTILLYTRLPSNLSETIKRKCGDQWLDFEEFKKGLEAEIHNLRAFPPSQSEIHSTKGTISTFTVDQNTRFKPSVRPKEVRTKLCALCEGSHIWIYCKLYNSREKKMEKLKHLGLCYVCASNRHISSDCGGSACGKGCTYRHHAVICPRLDKKEAHKSSSQKQVKKSKNNTDKNEGVQIATLSLTEENKKNKFVKQSILPTATITLKGKRGQVTKKRGLLDPCAERTFIKRSVLTEINYKVKGKERMSLRGYLTIKPVQEYEIVTIFIPHKGRLINLDCVVVEELPEYIKKFDVKKHLRKICRAKINLADKDFDLTLDRQSPIELLVGVDNVYNILHPGFRRIEDLVLLPTIFGYVLTGTCRSMPNEETHISILKLAVETEELGATESPAVNLEKLWSLDHLGIDRNEITDQERKVLRNFEDTIVYSETDKQYVVALPWKGNKGRLTSNYGLALNRLKQQCTKFQKDTQFLENYMKVLKDQESRGFIERVEEFDSVELNNCHYLAHHGVKKDSVTTPLRLVFDCSARQGKNGLSLNDCLWTGPYITADLLKVLLQFRTNQFACISDIEKAFLMVQLREEDRNYTRFLWLEDPRDPNSKILIFRFRVVLFGATCSPFLLNATIRKHLSLVNEDVSHIRKGLYVDNLQYTSNSSTDLLNFYKTNKIFAEAHLYLKEWVTILQIMMTCKL